MSLTDKPPLPAQLDLAEEAAASLRLWHGLVRTLPGLVEPPDRGRALGPLVEWYARAINDGEYSMDPPIEALDVLVDELVHASVPPDAHRQLARGRWAIRLAEELVKWRQCFGGVAAGSVRSGLATDRLELTLEGARRQVDESHLL